MIPIALAWIRAHRGAAAVYGLVAIAIIIGFARGSPAPKIPAREQKSIDWLDMTRPGFLARTDTLYRTEVKYVQAGEHKAAVADSTHVNVDSLRQRALIAEAVAFASRDTSTQWRAAALAWHQTADSLTTETDTLRASRDDEKAARLQADARAALVRVRLDSSEDLNRRLAKDVKGARGGILRRLADRVGVSAGYGVQMANDGTIRHGPTVSLGVKFWP
jgi:hypothetical protein